MKISYVENDISYRDYTEFIVIYNLRMKEVCILENVAADIWRIIAERRNVEIKDISHSIAALYDCEEESIVKDIEQFVKELYENGTIQIDEAYKDLSGENIAVKNDLNSSEERIMQRVIQKMQEMNQIYFATFEMTYACNEKCIHCYVNSPEESELSPQISIEKYKSIIDELLEINCMHLIFTGGDPFMYEGFEDVFRYARTKGFVCDIYTNALYLADNKNTLEEILSMRPRAFYISLYGASAKMHDKVTTIEGSFYKTIAAIKQIKKRGIMIVLNVMLLSVNYTEIQDIIDLAKKLGVEYRVSVSLIYKNDGSSQPMNYFINDKSIIKNAMKIVKDSMYSIDVPIGESKDEKNESICGAGVTSISISPDGIVYPCISLKVPLGRVFDEKMDSIWKGDKRRRLIQSLTWENTKECMECESREECPHCIGISQFESGDMFACNTCDKMVSECLHELKNEMSTT